MSLVSSTAASPIASIIGELAITLLSTCDSVSPAPPTEAKYLNTEMLGNILDTTEDKPHAVLGRDSLPSPTLPGHDDGLVDVVSFHQLECLL